MFKSAFWFCRKEFEDDSVMIWKEFENNLKNEFECFRTITE